MKKNDCHLLFLILLLLPCLAAMAQENPPFWNDIQAFKKRDSLQPPPQHAILFVGSSSFTNWKDVADYFPKHTIINRGFGGSSLTDLIRYADDIIMPYKPKQIVLYCGENDIAGDSTVTGRIVFERFKNLFTRIRKSLPGVPLVYVSMKPSPSRWHLRKKMQASNRLIQTFLQQQRHTAFVNVWPAMLGRDGKPREELFLDDMLHMKPQGYVIWQKLIGPFLKKKDALKPQRHKDTKEHKA